MKRVNLEVNTNEHEQSRKFTIVSLNMNILRLKIVTISCLLCCMLITVHAENSADSISKTSFFFNADLVNRYVWRGQMFSPNVNIQPYGGISFKGLSFTTWASYGISDRYAEIDFSISYTIGRFSITVSDYYNENEDSLAKNRHFNLNSKSTPHSLECALYYKIMESFPLTVTVASYFYGNDKDVNGNNYYSTYIEASYPIKISNSDISVFIGGTPNKGLYTQYTSNTGIVNLGFSAVKNLKISELNSIPLGFSVVSNPTFEDIFIIFKIIF
jgi:hypothetical protein